MNQGNQQEIPDYQDSLAEGFLKNIPDEQARSIISPYVKDWDSKVGEKFREIHESYKPYKELGNVEDVQAALEFVASLNDDPVNTYKQLTELLISEGLLDVPVEDNEQGNGTVEVPEVPGIPKEFMTEFQNMKKELESVRTTVSNVEQARIDASEKAELDSYMKQLHTEHGEFDDHFVLSKLAAGIPAKDAVQSFKDTIAKFTQGSTSSTPNKLPPPKVFTGPAGSHPQEQARKPFESASDRKKFVLEALLAANTDQ